MRTQTAEVLSLVRDQQGVLHRSDVPELGGALDWLARRGVLVQVLPSTYVRAGAEEDPLVRMLAARRWAPDGVLRGRAAARLTFWPELVVDDVAYSVRTRQLRRPGYRLDRQHVAVDHVLEQTPWRCTSVPRTVLDLCPEVGGDVIDEGLRRRVVTVEQLRTALDATSRRPGNPQRLQLLLDSRAEPWSAAERRAHSLLRTAGVGGWVANHPVQVGGQRYYLDIAFVARRLAIEVDGRAYHDASRFEADRTRHNELTAVGWTVLHLTWAMLQDPAAVIGLVEQTLRTCAP